MGTQRTTFGRKLQKTIETIKKYENFVSTDKATSRSTLNFESILGNILNFNNLLKNTFISNIMIRSEKYSSF